MKNHYVPEFLQRPWADTNPDGTPGSKDMADALANAIFVANTKMEFL